MRKLLIFLALFLPASEAFATTYYVDWSGGSDSNNGTSSATPWKHIPGDDGATGNAAITLSPGDTVVVKGGVTYLGTATVTDSTAQRRVFTANASGISGNPITFISGHVYSVPWGTGRAVMDGTDRGAGALKSGFYAKNKSYITLEGFEIRNIGRYAGDLTQPIQDAAGVECENQTGYVGVGGEGWILRDLLIHDINWVSPYRRAYGFESNHCNGSLFEKSEVYNATDKLYEIAGTGLDGGTDSQRHVAKFNYFHNAAVHCAVITGYNNDFFNNLIEECHDGVITGAGGAAPNPGFALKIDQGSNNRVYNNIAQKVSSGFGVLNGRNNELNHNIVFGLGLNGGGTHGGGDEAGFLLYNNDNAWGPAGVSGNKIQNNTCYYIPNVTTSSKPKCMAHNKDAGSNNEVKNNNFFAALGDTTATATRIRTNDNAFRFVGGTYTYRSIATWESTFNADFGGTGNVASGNYSVDPQFAGGALTAFTNFPDGFLPDWSDFNTGSFHIGAAGQLTGITLSSPFTLDVRGAARPPFYPGPYSGSGPILSSVTPGAGYRNATTAVTLAGSGFQGGNASVSVSGTGVTVNNLSVVSDIAITADFAITAGATLGARDVTVTTDAGTSGAQSFEILAVNLPLLTSISPVEGYRGTAPVVTLTGTSLNGMSSTVSVSGSGVTPSGCVHASTSITCTFTIAADALLSSREVTVTDSNGTSNALTFTPITADLGSPLILRLR